MASFNDLTPEQMEKARECKTADDLVKLAEAEGIELNDEQLDAIAGGSWYNCMNETW
jgi:hypothetical protein